MTSLTGSAGEDFASILRALGYRMERRPPLPPKPVVVEAPAAEAAPPEAAPEASAEADPEAAVEAAATEAVSAETPEVAESADVHEVSESAPSATLLPDVAFAPAVTAEAVPAVEAQPESARPDRGSGSRSGRGSRLLSKLTSETPAVSDAAPSAEAPAADALRCAAAPEAAAVPELIEVWRPGGRPEERRPRHDRARHRHHDRPQEGAAPAARLRPVSPAKPQNTSGTGAAPRPQSRVPQAPSGCAGRRRAGSGRRRGRAGQRTARGQGPSAARAF